MSEPLILVTGATGTIGGEVVRQLADEGRRVAALVRDAAKAAFPAGVDIRIGDLSDPATLASAFDGVDKTLVVVNGLGLATLEANAFDAATSAGVNHIVKISGRHVDADFLAGSVLAEWHNRSESRLRGLGVRWTILRPATLMSNLWLWLTDGRIALPVGDGKDTFVDPRDVAAVAVKVLAGTGHDGATYELTGPEFVSYAHAAERLGKAIGTAVKLVDVRGDTARAGLLSAGLPPSQADALLMLFDGIRAGKVYPPTQTVAELLGRPARSLDDWLADIYRKV